jgi:hypothetical protein
MQDTLQLLETRLVLVLTVTLQNRPLAATTLQTVLVVVVIRVQLQRVQAEVG